MFRIAVIGLGYWGKHYLRLVSQHVDCELIAMCDVVESLVVAQKTHYPNALVYTDVDTLLQEIGSRLHGVIIAVQASLHHEVASKILDHGVNILVEKPLTTKLIDAKELLDKAVKNSKTLFVGHTFLFNPAIQKVKQLIEKGEAGQIYNIYATRTNMGPFRKDVNAIWDLAPHDIAIVNHLLDAQPIWASAHASRPLNTNLEDIGYIVLCYPKDILVNIHVSWLDPEKVREVCLVGSKAQVKFNDLAVGKQVQIYYKSVSNLNSEQKNNGTAVHNGTSEILSYGEHNLVVQDGDVLIPSLKMTEPLRNQLQYFVKCLQGHISKDQQVADAEFGVQVVKAMVAIERSIQNQGARVYLADL